MQINCSIIISKLFRAKSNDTESIIFKIFYLNDAQARNNIIIPNNYSG